MFMHLPDFRKVQTFFKQVYLQRPLT